MWKEDLDGGRRVAVVLSEKDQIVDVVVRKYLTGEESLRWERDGLEVLCRYPGLDHATVWDTEERRKPLLEIVRRFTVTASVGGTYCGSARVLDPSTELETRSSTTL